jgi:hypothetical protein
MRVDFPSSTEPAVVNRNKLVLVSCFLTILVLRVYRVYGVYRVYAFNTLTKLPC